MKKITRYLLKLLTCTMMITSLPIQKTYAIEETISPEEGILVGDVIYEYDQYGNVTESVVDLENAITEQEALIEYYSKFMGQSEIVNDTDEFIVLYANTEWTNETIEKDVYIQEGVTLTTNDEVIITGNVYPIAASGCLPNTETK